MKGKSGREKARCKKLVGLMCTVMLTGSLLLSGTVWAQEQGLDKNEYTATATQNGLQSSNGLGSGGSVWARGSADGYWGIRSSGGFTNSGTLYALGAGGIAISGFAAGGGLGIDGMFTNSGTVHAFGGISLGVNPAASGIYAAGGFANTGTVYANGGYGQDSGNPPNSGHGIYSGGGGFHQFR